MLRACRRTAVLVVLLVGFAVLMHLLFGHGHRWHGDRFVPGPYGEDRFSGQ